MTAQSGSNRDFLKTRLRPMRPTDLSLVLAIENLSFGTPWPKSAYEYELNQNKNSLLWVAEALQPDGEYLVVGMVVIWLILDETHIATLAVHPDYRGHGIARCLLMTALKEAIKKGATEATLEVRATNNAAQELYRRFKFKIVGHRPRYYRDNNEDAIIMTVSQLDEMYINWLDTRERKDEACVIHAPAN